MGIRNFWNEVKLKTGPPQGKQIPHQEKKRLLTWTWVHAEFFSKSPSYKEKKDF